MISLDYDLDLFYPLSADGGYLHLATAGGAVPDSIFKEVRHRRIRSKIRALPDELRMSTALSPNLDRIIEGKRRKMADRNFGEGVDSPDFDQEAYVRDFVNYASFGFYSFDRTDVSNPNGSGYHLVAYPVFDSKYFKICELLFGERNVKYPSPKLVDICSTFGLDFYWADGGGFVGGVIEVDFSDY